jgi:peroxiredoxin
MTSSRALALGALLAVSGCATTGSGGANVPGLALQDTRGRTHYLTDYIGRKVVVLSFWATWCQPCRQELLMLEQVYRDYQQDGLVVLAINTDGPETQAAVRNFVIQHGLSFPVLIDAETRVVSLYNPRKQLPMMHIFSKSGRLVYSHSTFQPGEAAALKARILSALNRGAVEEERDKEPEREKSEEDAKEKREEGESGFE